MTIRAILLGLMGACVICGLTYFNDIVMNQTGLIGSHMPISVYGGLVLFLLFANPLLLRIKRKLALRGKELAVILAMTLASCCIPASGLMRSFTTAIIGVYHYNRTQPGWNEQGVIDMTPPAMRADLDFSEVVFHDIDSSGRRATRRLTGKIIARDAKSITIKDLNQDTHVIRADWVQEIRDVGKDLVLDGYIKGLPRENLTQHITLSDIPWYAWKRPLSFWLPLLLVLWVGLIGLSVAVHRQWSQHEQLAYPLAKFTNALLPNEGEACGGVFGNRLFWVGAVSVLTLHLNNYACAWYPDALIRIPTSFDLRFIFTAIPVLHQAHLGGGINAVQQMMLLRVYFSAVAFAYFLPKDVSLSIGLGSYLFMWVAGISFSYGVWRGDMPHIPKLQNMFTCGAYLGIFLAILYTGRYYYANIFRRALFLPTREQIAIDSVWGARIFLVAIGVFVMILTSGGLDWPLAALYALLLVIIYLVMSRILAETGMFYIMPWWSPGVVLLGFMGTKALGPQVILILNLLAVVLVFGYQAVPAREALMPYVINSLKLLELRQVKISRGAIACAVAVVLGLTVALPVTLWFQYDRGILAAGGYHTLSPRHAYVPAVRAQLELMAQVNLELSNSLSGLDRFTHARPDTRSLIYFSIGLGLVLLFTTARLRFPKFPLHPVLFLVWITHPGRVFAPSFLIGWLVKLLVTKYGGATFYRKGMPLMFGLIAGEMLGGVIPMVVGAIYHLATGQIPKRGEVLLGM